MIESRICFNQSSQSRPIPARSRPPGAERRPAATGTVGAAQLGFSGATGDIPVDRCGAVSVHPIPGQNWDLIIRAILKFDAF
jgi:hypothetical protein